MLVLNNNHFIEKNSTNDSRIYRSRFKYSSTSPSSVHNLNQSKHNENNNKNNDNFDDVAETLTKETKTFCTLSLLKNKADLVEPVEPVEYENSNKKKNNINNNKRSFAHMVCGILSENCNKSEENDQENLKPMLKSVSFYKKNSFLSLKCIPSNRMCKYGVDKNSSNHHSKSLIHQMIPNIKILENSVYQNLRIKRNRKAARMLGLLVATFSICWLPYTIFYPLSHFYPNLLPDYATLFVWWLGYTNSAINPFLYVYSNKNIRRSVRNLFCKRIIYSFTGQNHANFRIDSLKANNIKLINK
jgi:hypothetical protein